MSQENLHLSLDGPALTVSPREDPEKPMFEAAICHVVGGLPLRPRCWQPPQGPHRTPSHNSAPSLSQKHPEPLHKPGGELGSSPVLTPGSPQLSLVFTSVWLPWMLNTKLSSARSSFLPSTLVVGNPLPVPPGRVRGHGECCLGRMCHLLACDSPERPLPYGTSFKVVAMSPALDPQFLQRAQPPGLRTRASPPLREPPGL